MVGKVKRNKENQNNLITMQIFQLSPSRVGVELKVAYTEYLNSDSGSRGSNKINTNYKKSAREQQN